MMTSNLRRRDQAVTQADGSTIFEFDVNLFWLANEAADFTLEYCKTTNCVWFNRILPSNTGPVSRWNLTCDVNDLVYNISY